MKDNRSPPQNTTDGAPLSTNRSLQNEPTGLTSHFLLKFFRPHPAPADTLVFSVVFRGRLGTRERSGRGGFGASQQLSTGAANLLRASVSRPAISAWGAGRDRPPERGVQTEAAAVTSGRQSSRFLYDITAITPCSGVTGTRSYGAHHSRSDAQTPVTKFSGGKGSSEANKRKHSPQKLALSAAASGITGNPFSPAGGKKEMAGSVGNCNGRRRLS